ncbi:hypothetical protein HPB51_005761 [Rhipicephalus microplus]|uniref:Uncharacterized protein n=1 Tax=Rhipicephalus microplus TaxID=6941 RepID=A0A9J6DTT0_RHIMP|nr:hypothetical protein HPB51_005761 [Rhipicephalus microplus]
MSHTEFANLPREIFIALGKPYMITTNINLIGGLVNRVIVILKVCEKVINDGEFPKDLWLQFDGKLGRFRSKRMVNKAKRSGHVIDTSWVLIEA